MEHELDKIIRVLDYTEYPGPRYCEQGKNSGEEFYHKVLNERFAAAWESKKNIVVDLDRTAGYASSFLDEAIGNLVYDFSLEIVKPRLEIISNQEKDWIDMIKNKVMPDWETRRVQNTVPKKTSEHESWFKLINGTLKKDKWL